MSRVGRSLKAHPWRTSILVIVILIAGVAVAGLEWYEGQSNPGRQGAQQLVSVRSGASVSRVSGTLVRLDVVGSTIAFHIYLTVHGTPTVQPGSYLLYRHESYGKIVATLASGPNVFPITVPAGFTELEVSERVAQLPGRDASTFLAAASKVTSPLDPPGSSTLDGLMGTGTYLVLPTESDTTLAQQMVDRFTSEATSAGLTSKAAALGITPYQAVTVASIVQKEGVYSENLGPVARVIYNRLSAGMPLQMDSTVLYAEHRDGGPVTETDLEVNTPYNTYLHTGLTPTPICFPSMASLQAALTPPPGAWRYFVVVSADGTEAFSDTLAGQEANEQLAKSRGLS